ncbi:NUDIX hydrolase [Rathayibacter soli]|uniref:NUDIX hydrolase n=1 Tax=Rathayibacter soli TaxID=3144168 RepID=UPI0027E4CAF2|nr:NUDIX domain-containing protein [Glaciibacter superstes]
MDRVLAAGAVVKDSDGRFLLVLRSDEPQAGRWSIPGGKLEPAETLAQAAEREVLEETGLVVRVTREVGCFESPTADGRVFEIHDFSAELADAANSAGGHAGAHPIAADDAADAGWFMADELRTLPLTKGLIACLIQFGLYP